MSLLSIELSRERIRDLERGSAREHPATRADVIRKIRRTRRLAWTKAIRRSQLLANR
jgi:hypothetical protein